MIEWSDLLIRALAGGAIVSAFAILGDVLRPKSFAGLFGAAPSVALASLAITFRTHDEAYVAREAGAMAIGALAFAAYAFVVFRALTHGRQSVRRVVISRLIVWVAAAGVLGWVVLAHRN
jgi:hypothetical protein